ncbi:MAG TPA: hypothetical protein VK552_09615, partial [Reyranella sp.]|nr:hypothetical protein [Reyranella sp.]
SSIIDDTEAIARRLRAIKQQEGAVRPEPVVDGAYLIASGARLDDIARYYGLVPRGLGESDGQLRIRIVHQIVRLGQLRIVPSQ